MGAHFPNSSCLGFPSPAHLPSLGNWKKEGWGGHIFLPRWAFCSNGLMKAPLFPLKADGSRMGAPLLVLFILAVEKETQPNRENICLCLNPPLLYQFSLVLCPSQPSGLPAKVLTFHPYPSKFSTFPVVLILRKLNADSMSPPSLKIGFFSCSLEVGAFGTRRWPGDRSEMTLELKSVCTTEGWHDFHSLAHSCSITKNEATSGGV